MSDGPSVTIAGGGLAGLTAALRLAQRGYRVKIYEQKSMLGGNLGSRPTAGVDLDVYPHMYLNWYHNFWGLLADVSVDRDELFAPFHAVKQLRRGEFPKFTGLTDMYSPWRMIPNLFSGVGPMPDMFVFGYSSIDLLAERLNPTMRLSQMSVSGFLNARPYVTTRASDAYDSFITRVWGIPSYLTSADDFRDYLRFSLAAPTPSFWLPRGSALQRVIDPIVTALKGAGVEITTEVEVTGVSCSDGRVTEISLRDTAFDSRTCTWVGKRGTSRTESVDELVLAVPAVTLATLMRKPAQRRQTSVVEEAPEIAGVARLRAVQVPILYLYFNRKLSQIPPEPVGLFDSQFALAFTDISQTWQGVPEFAGQTVLALSCSDPSTLPGSDRDQDAQAMLSELARYLRFDPGREWGESAEIDWKRTKYEPNMDAQLFVNETGSDAWRPHASSDGISNMYVAGDFADNHIGMTTIESAVTAGLQAAAAIVKRRGLGAPVEIVKPNSSIAWDLAYVWLRYAWAPYVCAASALSLGSDVVSRVAAVVARRGAGLRWGR